MTAKQQYKQAYALYRELALLSGAKITQFQEIEVSNQLNQIPRSIRDAAWQSYKNFFYVDCDIALQKHAWQFQEDYQNFRTAKRSARQYGSRFLHEYLTRIRNRRYVRTRRRIGRKYERKIP